MDGAVMEKRAAETETLLSYLLSFIFRRRKIFSLQPIILEQ
jgi:hypothetical protein